MLRLCILVLFLANASRGQPSACKFQGGLDFNPLQSTTDYAIPYGSGTNAGTFYVNMCRPLAVARNCAGASPGACQLFGNPPSTLGLSTTISATYPAGGGVDLAYTGGREGRSYVVRMRCGTGPGTPQYVQESPKLNYIFSWSTQYACPPSNNGGTPTASEGGLSGGSIFLIIVFVSAAVYLAGGVLFNYRRQETGMRLIPQFELWATIPSLVKDGVAFIGDKFSSVRQRYTSV